MAENSNIEWCDHSLNFWTGCEPISPACAHCYAEAWAKRAGRVFSERRQTTEATRRKAYKYQHDAWDFTLEHGRRQRVFVNSLSDWADNNVPQAWRDDIFETARACPDIDFLLLTKRIGNAKHMLPADWGNGYPNVWLGATFANQLELARDYGKLAALPAVVHFASFEPLLGPIDLTRVELAGIDWRDGRHGALVINALKGSKALAWAPLSWVISGGESGPAARPPHPAWIRALRDQCIDHGTAFLFKQWGEWLPELGSGRHGSCPDPSRHHSFGDGWGAYRVGKKTAGRALDGRTWDEFPKIEPSEIAPR